MTVKSHGKNSWYTILWQSKKTMRILTLIKFSLFGRSSIGSFYWKDLFFLDVIPIYWLFVSRHNVLEKYRAKPIISLIYKLLSDFFMLQFLLNNHQDLKQVFITPKFDLPIKYKFFSLQEENVYKPDIFRIRKSSSCKYFMIKSCISLSYGLLPIIRR